MTIMFVVVQWFSGCCCGWPSLSSAYSSSSRRTRASSNSLIILAALLMIQVRFSDPTNVHLQVQHLQVQQPQHFVANNSSAASIGDVAATRPHRRSRRHCPSCRLPLTPIHVHRQTEGEEEEGEEEDGQKSSLDVVVAQQQHQTTIGESARLESIKRQILIKLGLNAKPNLLSSVIPPRDFILETLLRAEESSSSRPHQSQSQSPQGKQAQPHHPHHSQADGSVDNVIVDDDFYGKTSEIIAFGEPGPRLNGQILAEFSRVQETAPESSLRVKSATLWIYVQLNGSLIVPPPPPHPIRADRHVHQQHQQQQQQQQRTSRSPTLYVFRLLSSPEPLANASGTSDKGWNELLLASQKVTIQHSGWMKINISEGVQKWFGTSSSPTSGSDNKLRLLVDCSGCGSNVQPVLFVVPQSQQVDALGSDGDGYGQQQTSSSKKKKKKKRKKRKKRRRRLVEDEEEEKQQQEEDQRNKEQQQQQVQHRPFIVIHTDSSSSRRLRRRTPLDCSPTTSACCKQRFFVSFRALGWDDWIIAPSGYYANYCRGDCGGGGAGAGGARAPESFLSYHSHVIDQVRKQLPLALSSHSNNKKKSKKKKLLAEQQQQQQQMFANYLQPCCAPTKFSSMSLIYFGPDMNIIKRDLPKMVVDECGCP